jgi:Xaa-Pro aminopeptidase
MNTRPSARFLPRLARARAEILRASADALVVTHLPNIQYLCGFSGSAGLILLTESRCVLVVDFRYAASARSLIESNPELAEALDLVVPAGSYEETLLALLRRSGASRIGIEAAWMSVSRFNWLSSSLAQADPAMEGRPAAIPELVPTERIVERGRLIKDGGEISTLREAARRLASLALEVPGLIREGRTELEIGADIDALLRRAGFERPAFETIVASGPNSARPHARPSPRVLERGDGVVLDFGGVYDGYCVDLSRTVQLGNDRPEFRRILEAVAEAQAAAIASVRPGIPASAVDAAAREVLRRHGLADAFGHGTGHGLGLEVHEEPRIGRPVAGLPDVLLAPGMVFTIEPGAYVEDIGGVRIEDDVLVTEAGCEVLTRPDTLCDVGG